MSIKLEIQWQCYLKYLSFFRLYQTKNIVKSLLKENNDLDIDFYKAENHLFNQNKYSITALPETCWLSRADTLSWAIANYTLLVEILEKIGDKSNEQSRSDAISFTY